MTDFRIDILVNSRQARTEVNKVEEALDRTERKSSTLEQQLRRTFAVVGVAALTSQLFRLIDAYTILQNRIRVVTDSTAELTFVTRELLDVSIRSRSAFENTVQLYTRVSLATRELGITQRDTLKFTESLNQALILSGANTREASSGLIQLSQALASGVLRGDELRSVLENLPVVADVIAESLGVTRGDLRDLGAEGVLTSEIIIAAFQRAAEDLQTRFAETTPTIQQAFTILRSEAVFFAGRVNDAANSTDIFREAILFAANNLENFARLALSAGIALSVGLVRRGLIPAIAQVRLFSAAIVANPIGALATALTLTTSTLIAFSDQIKISENNVATLQDVAVVGLSDIGEVISSLAEDVVSLGEDWEMTFDSIELSMLGFLRFLAEVADRVIARFELVIKPLVVVFKALPGVLENALVEGFNSLSSKLTSAINVFIQNFNALSAKIGGPILEEFEALELQANDSVKSIQAALREAAQAGEFIPSTRFRDFLESTVAEAEEIAQKRVEAEQKAQEEIDAIRNADKGVALDTDQTFGQGFADTFEQLSTKVGGLDQQLSQLGSRTAEIFGPGGTLSQGVGDAVAGAIVFGESFSASLRQVGRLILSQLISGIIQFGINLALQATIGRALAAAATAQAVASATAISTAWTPAAVSASIATLGGAAATGSAAFAAAQASGIATATAAQTGASATGAAGAGSRATVPEFRDGGQVRGPGGPRTDSITAKLSNGEFVVNANATRKNLALLEAINNGRVDSTLNSSPGAVFGDINVSVDNSGGRLDEREVARQVRKQIANELRTNGLLEQQGRRR